MADERILRSFRELRCLFAHGVVVARFERCDQSAELGIVGFTLFLVILYLAIKTLIIKGKIKPPTS